MLPPLINNQEGRERTVGYEIEFTGIELFRTAEIIRELWGGEINRHSEFEATVEDSRLGDFRLELDASLIREKRYEKFLGNLGLNIPGEKKQNIEEWILDAASPWIPFEVITPPVPLTKMHQLNDLITQMRSEKARGTGESVFFAFGMHINPEIPEQSAASIIQHLRSYLLLDPWIREEADIDLSRRISPFIDPFDKRFSRKVLDPDYDPDMATMIRDYFRFGNSRNRSLDLLPLFLFMDPETTEEFLEEELSSARPTFHYRLPDCRIDDPDWDLSVEWNRWVRVEELSQADAELEVLSRKWLKLDRALSLGKKKRWEKVIREWIDD